VRLRHYYHVYAAGAWALPVREHIAALGRAGFPGEMIVGLTGPEQDRARAREMIVLRMRGWDLPEPAGWEQADDGFEQVTLARLRADLHQGTDDAAVLYAHTKGARDNSDWNADWRRSMTRHVVGRWRECVQLLASGYDTAGCHWLTREEHHDPPDRVVTVPFYGGNFWWATARYLRTLPEPLTDYRHRAEEWLGTGSPKAYDLLPGWPVPELLNR